MTFALTPSTFPDESPAFEAGPTRLANRPANDLARLWRTLDHEHRLALIDDQLRAA